LLLAALLVDEMRLLFLGLDLLVNDLFLARLLTVVVAAGMLLLVPAVAAGAGLRHQPDLRKH